MFLDRGGRHYWFAENLRKNGYDPVIFCASTVHNSDKKIETDGRKYVEKATETGTKFVFVEATPYKGNGVSRVKNMLSFALNLYSAAKIYAKEHGKPDIILASSVHPLTIVTGILLGKYFKVPCIAEVRDLWPETLIACGIAGKYNPATLCLRRLEKWIYKTADAVIFTMGGAYDYIAEQHWEKDIPRKKIHYINNGTDLNIFKHNRDNFSVDDADLSDKNTFKVVYAGSVRSANNLGMLLDTAKKIKDDRVKILIWGDGDELPALKARQENEKIRNVVFKGRVGKKYIPYISSCADLNIVHLSPVSVLMFGISSNKLFDYFAAGKPVLSDFPSRYNPIEEYDAGIVLDDPSPENVAAAIEHIANIDEKAYMRYSENATKASLDFTFERLTEKLIDIIENL